MKTKPIIAALLLVLPTIPRLDAQPACDPLPPPTGPTVEVLPSQASSLRQIVADAATGTTILLHDGTYDLGCGDSGCRLVFQTSGVTLRSLSGNREAVILDGAYQTNELVSISASNITIGELTLMRAYDHPIHISGPGSAISGILIHDVHIIDPGQQAIKINPDATGLGVTVDSTIECSRIELTNTGRGFIRDNCYTGGIDGHATEGLLIRRNRIEGFWCDTGLSEHGVHLWRAASNTIVEENVILDCARGIGFGLGYGAANGHTGGIIRNNFIAAADTGLAQSPDGFDTGIGLESADGVEIYHNSVVSTFAPISSSIEWRWDLTSATVSNNLTTHALLERDGASATLDGNLTGAALAWFIDPAGGDLHLTDGSLAPIDAGVPLAAGLADRDFDGDDRDTLPDVGADEFPTPLFADGFESGDVGRWSSAAP